MHYYFTALFSSGGVLCWGLGSYGLGRDSVADLGSIGTMSTGKFIDFPTTYPVQQISAYSMHACALFVHGRAHCFGYNYEGALGLAVGLSHVGTSPALSITKTSLIPFAPNVLSVEMIAISAGS